VHGIGEASVKTEITDNGLSAAVVLSGLEQYLWDIQGAVLGVQL